MIVAMYDFSSIAFLLGNVPLAIFLAAASGGIIRTRVAPVAVGWLGLVAAAVSLVSGASFAREGAPSVHGGFGFVAVMLFLVWLLATSIALVVRAKRP